MAKTYLYKSIPIRLQNQQITAMRWLASLGLTAKEIREFGWGNVNETTRLVSVDASIVDYAYNREQGIVCRKTRRRSMHVSPVGSGTEWFFFKSPTPSLFWAFVKFYPKKQCWRREQQFDVLYPIDEIEEIIRDVVEIHGKISKNLLTFDSGFGTIRVAKANITNIRNQELTNKV